MPYLIRRAQENSAVLAGTTDDRALIRREIRRRLFGFMTTKKDGELGDVPPRLIH